MNIVNGLKNNYFWLLPPYFISVGVLYLWGYWPSFGINVFEYAGFMDLVKVAIIPVGSVFFLTLIGFFIGEAATGKRLPDGEGRNTKIGHILFKIRWVFIPIYFLILIYLFVTNIEGKWKIIPVVAMFIPYDILKHSSFLKEISSDSMRSIAIMSVSILPIYSFCLGKENALKIINGEEYKYNAVISGEHKLKYLGHISGIIFYISQDNSKIILQELTGEPVVLSSYKREVKKPNKVKH